MSLQSRYTILRKIADGGTAEIFLAKQHGAQGFEKAVVLKRILAALYADPQFRHMLVDEAHVAMSLNHSNIVQVLDLGEAEGRYFLALELVDGWTLDKVLRRAKTAGVPFPPALALYVSAEVCRALAYAHGKKRDGAPLGIVHRDISPHNVMLSAEGEVKLTDFGIAKVQNRQGRKEQSLGNVIKGKISFMSPEQASGAELDARSDLFSVGTMLYAMITRRLPFDAPTDYETLMLVKSGDYLPPETARPGLNPELYRVIRKAMGKTPGDRYQKADEMLVDVEQVMRLAFRPVGQTELQRWLADLTAKDGVQALTRESQTVVSGPPATVGPLGARAGAARAAAVGARPPVPGDDPGQESGVVLDLEDAVEVSGGAAPPPPPPAGGAMFDMGVGTAPGIIRPPGSAVAPPVPPTPGGAGGATEVMMQPGAFTWAEPWYRRRSARIGGAVVLLLLLGVSAKALMSGGKPPASAPGPAAGTATAAAEKDKAKDKETPAPAAAEPAPAAAPAPTPTPVAAASAALDAAAAAAPAAAAPALAEPAVPPPPPADETKPAAAVVAAGEPAPAEQEPGDEAGAAEKTAPTAAPASGAISVAIKSDPDGARVSTRHRSYGTTPTTLKLRAGKAYELTFTKAGYASLSKRYHVTEDGPQSIHVTLKKTADAPAKSPASSAKGASAKSAPAASAKAGSKSSAKKAAPAVEPRPAAAPAAAPEKKKGWFSR